MGLCRAKKMEPSSFSLYCSVAMCPMGGWIVELKLFLRSLAWLVCDLRTSLRTGEVRGSSHAQIVQVPISEAEHLPEPCCYDHGANG